MVPVAHFVRRRIPMLALFLGLGGCVALNMTLPSDDAPPEPISGRVKPTVGWLITGSQDSRGRMPDGTISVEIVHIKGRALLQEVQTFNTPKGIIGDSVLLDRTTLRPVETWRWTPKGSYSTTYYHRSVERIFRPLKGGPRRSQEILELEPYSALGLEMVIGSLPLSEGYRNRVPVVVDTAARGWTWAIIEVQRDMQISERSDQPTREEWIVDCTLEGYDKLRFYIAVDGRQLRKVQHLGKDNEVLSEYRRMLLEIPGKSE